VPQNLAVTTGDASMTIAWNTPSSNGGLTISRYEYSIDGGTMWNDVAANPTVLRGLRNGTTYAVKVRAFNDNGPSTATVAVSATPTTVPRTTGTPVATAGIRGATLAWTAPIDNGGTVITDYVIEYSDNAGGTWQTVTDGVSTATTVLVSNLTAGTSYLFRITAVNANGQGETSMVSNAVTPTAPVAAAPAPTPEPTPEPTPAAEPIATPVPAPVAGPVIQPVKKTKTDNPAPQTPVATPLPDVSMPMDNTATAALTDGAGTVFGMPESGWVRETLEVQGYTVRTSEDLYMQIRVNTGAPRVNVRGMPILRQGENLDILMTGLLPGSETSAWLFSTPVLLGRAEADASGAINAQYAIPDSLEPGFHTVQLNGITPDGTVRSIEVKIEVVRPATTDTTPDDTVSAVPVDNGSSTPTGLILMAATMGLLLALAAGLTLARRRRTPD
ncbi:MAG: fibronectin type III domain-containing protein, partial [Actinomycetota bacterium]